MLITSENAAPAAESPASDGAFPATRATRVASEHTFNSWDGAELFFRAWLPRGTARGSILLFHRGHEHSGRWQETVDSLGLEDFAIFAWDQRGHGHSPGERGSAESISVITRDADAFARHLSQAHGISLRDTAVVAHSVGAVIATAWVHDFGPPIRALVLAAPAFRVRLYVPLAIPLLRLKQKVLGGGFVKSYVKAHLLTHDPRQAQAYREDPLIFRQIAVNVLLDLQDTSTRLLADSGAINTPTLVLAAGTDWVVSLKAQQTFFARLGSRVKQMDVLPGFSHALFHEKDRQEVTGRIRKFLLARFDEPAEDEARLLGADQGGFTRTEYDLLRGPGGPKWKLVRGSLKVGAGFSRGIQLGCHSGFDSGATLDYVYLNKPAGFTPIGQLVDWFYLNSPGWRGIRIRGENLRRLLRQTIEQLHGEGRPIRLLDIASGPGRYVLETLSALPQIPASAVLRDYKPANVEAARRLAAELKLPDITVVQGDAFDRASLAATTPRPTIAIVSGLYELFPENAGVLRSLQGIADAMEPGGRLLYTTQPWHPQMEFIARALTNREGEPWVMRRRSQAEMDALVRAAGFDKLEQDIDPWGIFTVSVARRRDAST